MYYICIKISALWFHNVITEDFGVAVNVFWRHLEEKNYNKKDTYGNKDLIAGERALQGLDRALKVLESLPDDYRDFYARRMVINIENKGYTKEPCSKDNYASSNNVIASNSDVTKDNCDVIPKNGDVTTDICGVTSSSDTATNASAKMGFLL